jgi:hypothetical protein
VYIFILLHQVTARRYFTFYTCTVQVHVLVLVHVRIHEYTAKKFIGIAEVCWNFPFLMAENSITSIGHSKIIFCQV